MLHRLLLVLLLAGIYWKPNDNLIDWSPSRKLTWNDFKGSPDPASTNAALTNSSITAEFGYNQSGLTHSIKCRFNKSLSWGRIKNDYILNHEQGHFDVAEIYARVLHKELSAYRFNARTVSKDINRMYENVMKQHVVAQEQYDLQTNHSIDSVKQREWDGKIAAMLSEFAPYADYR